LLPPLVETAQNKGQTEQGSIIDKASAQNIPGAQVPITAQDPVKKINGDREGQFTFPNTVVKRY
jgi:hypothetical protein